jgi:phage terminase small subunit
MNEKHKEFCNVYLANGKNGTQAYLAVYKSVKKEEVARANASRLLTNASVQEYIKAEQDKSSQKLEITRESLLEDLKRIQSNTESTNPQAALKAVDLMIKMLGFNAPIKSETKLSGGLDVTKLFGFEEDDKTA